MIPSRLLVADDDAESCEFLRSVAMDCGFDVKSATCSADFERLLDEFKPGVILLDLAIPDVDGVELLRHLARVRSRARIILISAFDSRVRNAALGVGAGLNLRMEATLAKPVRIPELEALLRSLVPAREQLDRSDLERALEEDEIFLLYQPKVSIAAARICGAEALARWNHPELGSVSPDQFVPAFEQEGLAPRLSEKVLQVAARQSVRWKEEGLKIPVAVNISATELGDLAYPEHVFDLLKAFDLDPHELVLEVTETGAMEDVLRAADVLTRLRLRGLTISMDDFGTGYSSLVWLHRLPFSELKIDRGFVADLGRTEEAGILVTAIVELAHNLGLEVCAEGVETAAAWERLRALGCEMAQGFLLSRPIPGDELPAWAASWSGPPAR